jgi:sugar phosphate permease
VKKRDRVRFEDIKYFGLIFWILNGICILLYIIFALFGTTASEFLQTRFQFDATGAALMLMVSEVVAIPGSVVVGLISDKYGKRSSLCKSTITNYSYLVLLGSVCLLSTFILFSSLQDCDETCYSPLAGFILLGVTTAIFYVVFLSAVPYLYG